MYDALRIVLYSMMLSCVTQGPSGHCSIKSEVGFYLDQSRKIGRLSKSYTLKCVEIIFLKGQAIL